MDNNEMIVRLVDKTDIKYLIDARVYQERDMGNSLSL